MVRGVFVFRYGFMSVLSVSKRNQASGGIAWKRSITILKLIPAKGVVGFPGKIGRRVGNGIYYSRFCLRVCKAFRSGSGILFACRRPERLPPTDAHQDPWGCHPKTDVSGEEERASVFSRRGSGILLEPSKQCRNCSALSLISLVRGRTQCSDPLNASL